MPLFEYACEECGYEFEELITSSDNSDIIACKKCGSVSKKQISRFSASISNSSNESVDMKIGREANKRWQSYMDMQSKRRGNQELKQFDIPKTQDNKYMPVMALGDSAERSNRQEYVGALQDHRKKRIEKGQPQFAGPGSF